MMKLNSRFLVRYLKVMAGIALISAFLDMTMWITIRFTIPSWAGAVAWAGAGLMFFAVAKLIESEVKA